MAAQNAAAQRGYSASDDLGVSQAQQHHGLSVKPRAARMSQESLRTDSQAPRNDAKQEFLGAINEIRSRRGLSVEAMAVLAGVPVSTMSDALAGKDNRNFAGHWLIAQGDDFAADVMEALGVTAQSRIAADAQRIGELVALLIRRVA